MTFQRGDKNINRGGRPRGSIDFTKLARRVVKKKAKELGMKENELWELLILKAVDESMKGNFKYHQDLFNRVAGKPINYIDHTTLGDKLKEKTEVIFKDFSDKKNDK